MDRRIFPWMGLLLAVTGGCVQRTITITSDPPGALVYMNDQEIGRTPVTRDFTWYGKYDVQLRKDGYETLDTSANLVAPPWLWPPFDLFAELMPWHIKDIRDRNYTLKPASTEAEPNSVILARAYEMKSQLISSQYTHKPTTHPTTEPSK